MQSTILSFILKLLLLTLAIGAGFYSLQGYASADYLYPDYAALLCFFFGVTLMLHMGYEKHFKKGSKNFVRFYMLASGIKLFSFLTIIIAYAFIDKDHLKSFALNFLILYFIYTTFEIMVSYNKFGSGGDPLEPDLSKYKV